MSNELHLVETEQRRPMDAFIMTKEWKEACADAEVPTVSKDENGTLTFKTKYPFTDSTNGSILLGLNLAQQMYPEDEWPKSIRLTSRILGSQLNIYVITDPQELDLVYSDKANIDQAVLQKEVMQELTNGGQLLGATDPNTHKGIKNLIDPQMHYRAFGRYTGFIRESIQNFLGESKFGEPLSEKKLTAAVNNGMLKVLFGEIDEPESALIMTKLSEYMFEKAQGIGMRTVIGNKLQRGLPFIGNLINNRIKGFQNSRKIEAINSTFGEATAARDIFLQELCTKIINNPEIADNYGVLGHALQAVSTKYSQPESGGLLKDMPIAKIQDLVLKSMADVVLAAFDTTDNLTKSTIELIATLSYEEQFDFFNTLRSIKTKGLEIGDIINLVDEQCPLFKKILFTTLTYHTPAALSLKHITNAVGSIPANSDIYAHFALCATKQYFANSTHFTSIYPSKEEMYNLIMSLDGDFIKTFNIAAHPAFNQSAHICSGRFMGAAFTYMMGLGMAERGVNNVNSQKIGKIVKGSSTGRHGRRILLG